MGRTAAETSPWDVGLYSLAESARYGSIPASTLGRWLARRTPTGTLREELVSFDELVSLLFVRQLTRQHVRMKDILTAESDLRERTGHQHPFVHETLWVAGRDVMVRVPATDGEFLAANRRGQMGLPGLIEPKLVELPELVTDVRGRLGYDGGRAVVWRPADRIAARPIVQFGLTCIEGTRLTTRAVCEAVDAGDDNVTLAHMFEVAESDIELAVQWEHQLAA